MWWVLAYTLMALSAHAGSFNITLGAAASTVPVTGVGFTPKVVLFWWNGRTAAVDAAGRASHQRGFGWAEENATAAAVGTRSTDANAASAAHAAHSNGACVVEVSTTPAIVGAASVNSFDTDGFTVQIDDQFVTDLRVHYLALGGDTIVDTRSLEFIPAGSAPVTQDITGFGFTPDLVFFIGGPAGLTPVDTAASDSAMCLGVTTATGQAVWAGGSNASAATMQTLAYCRAGECFARFNGGVSALNDRAEFSAFIEDGVRINWLERTGTGVVSVLGIQGISAVVGDLLTQTDTTTPIVENGLGFRPAGALFVSANRAADAADTPTDHDEWSVGAGSGPAARNAAATIDVDNVADSEVATASEFDAVCVQQTSSAVTGLLDLVSLDGDGLTCIMDDAAPTQAFVWYVALGPVAETRRRFFLT